MESYTPDPYTPPELPLNVINWESHIGEISDSNTALATYNGILRMMVDPRLLLTPLRTREAVISSRIEGTIVSIEEILKFEADIKEGYEQRKVDDFNEVLNYRTAMGNAVKALEERPLTINLIRDMHRTLLSDVRGQDREPGEIRRTQVYVNSGDGIYTPPAPPTDHGCTNKLGELFTR